MSPSSAVSEQASQCAHLGDEARLNEILSVAFAQVDLVDVALMGLKGGHVALVERFLARPDVKAARQNPDFITPFQWAIQNDQAAAVEAFLTEGYLWLAIRRSWHLQAAINHGSSAVVATLLPHVDLAGSEANLIQAAADTFSGSAFEDRPHRLDIARQIMRVCDPRLNHSAALMTAVRNGDDAMVALLWPQSDPEDLAAVCIANEQWSDLDSLAAYMPLTVQEDWARRYPDERLPMTNERVRVRHRVQQLERLDAVSCRRPRPRG